MVNCSKILKTSNKCRREKFIRYTIQEQQKSNMILTTFFFDFLQDPRNTGTSPNLPIFEKREVWATIFRNHKITDDLWRGVQARFDLNFYGRLNFLHESLPDFGYFLINLLQWPFHLLQGIVFMEICIYLRSTLFYHLQQKFQFGSLLVLGSEITCYFKISWIKRSSEKRKPTEH